jgi:predicted O-methyltransferase YrrM
MADNWQTTFLMILLIMFFSKIRFLIKSKTPFSIILLFLITKLKNILVKREISKQKKLNQSNIKNFQISMDWFSSQSYFFKYFMMKLFKDFKYLEIGSFEGNSAIFVSSNFPESKITCVDPWANYEENKNSDMLNIEKIFDKNIQNFKNIKKIKKTSENFFITNKEMYNFIYIDGYHKYEYVLKDCLSSWEILSPGGFLVCDDYIWDFYKKDIKLNPCFAINEFLRIKNKEVKVLLVSNSQIFIKKLIIN